MVKWDQADPTNGLAGQRVNLLQPPAPGDYGSDNITYGDWRDDPNGMWFVVERLSGSDYSGGTLAKSNFRVFVEEFAQYPEFFVETSGGYATYGIVIDIAKTPDEAWEVLHKLEDYPAIDDEDLSNLEMELSDEAWDSWARSDFLRALETAFNCDNCAMADDEELREIFEAYREEANVYWEPNGSEPSMHIDIDRIVESIDTVPHFCEDCPTEDATEEEDEEELGRINPYYGDSSMPPPNYGGQPPAPPIHLTRKLAAARPEDRDSIIESERERIRFYRSQGLREGYDYNPHEGYARLQFQFGSTLQQYLDADPYRHIRSAGDDFSKGYTVFQNLTWPANPGVSALLLVHFRHRHRGRLGNKYTGRHVVLWDADDSDHYSYYEVPLEVSPSTILITDNWPRETWEAIHAAKADFYKADNVNGINYEDIVQAGIGPWENGRHAYPRALFYLWALKVSPVGLKTALLKSPDVIALRLGRCDLMRYWAAVFRRWSRILKDEGDRVSSDVWYEQVEDCEKAAPGTMVTLSAPSPESPAPRRRPARKASNIVDPYRGDPTMPPPFYGEHEPALPRSLQPGALAYGHDWLPPRPVRELSDEEKQILLDRLRSRIASYRRSGLREGYDYNGARYYVWTARSTGEGVMQGDSPDGPYDWSSATAYARIGALHGERPRLVTRGRDARRIVRVYGAGTGERLWPNPIERQFSLEDARQIGNAIGVPWSEVNIEEFRRGLSVELEHEVDPETNVTHGDVLALGKIAWAHLKEDGAYYTKLASLGL